MFVILTPITAQHSCCCWELQKPHYTMIVGPGPPSSVLCTWTWSPTATSC